MKMMPGDSKGLKAAKNMKVVKAMKERRSRLLVKMKCSENHLEGYAHVRSKLLAEAAGEGRSSVSGAHDWARARAKLFAKTGIRAPVPRSSAAGSSIARSSTDRCDVDEFDDRDVHHKRPIYHPKVSDAIVDAEGKP